MSIHSHTADAADTTRASEARVPREWRKEEEAMTSRA